MTKNDGGPAFAHGDYTHGGHPGMTLRDWFAGQALVGFLTKWTGSQSWFAEEAYRVADAMIAERAKANQD